jgi:hypothetical protein
MRSPLLAGPGGRGLKGWPRRRRCALPHGGCVRRRRRLCGRAGLGRLRREERCRRARRFPLCWSAGARRGRIGPVTMARGDRGIERCRDPGNPLLHPRRGRRSWAGDGRCGRQVVCTKVEAHASQRVEQPNDHPNGDPGQQGCSLPVGQLHEPTPTVRHPTMTTLFMRHKTRGNAHRHLLGYPFTRKPG